MGNILDPLLRSPNQIQNVRGFAEKATDVTIDGKTVTVQTAFPRARVDVFYHSDDEMIEIPAPIFDKDGNRLSASFVTAGDDAIYEMFVETGYYDLKFSDGVNFAPFRIPLKVESRTFNVHDYGAKGNNQADDTDAIRAAIDAMLKANIPVPGPNPPSPNVADSVGTLHFPNGTYRVSEAIELPTGIIIQGTNSQVTGVATANCQIALTVTGQSIFKIKGGSHKIAIRDIGLTRVVDVSIAGTVGIKAEGVNSDGNVTQIEFHNLAIWSLDRGISVAAVLHVPNIPIEDRIWDFTNVKVSQCTIVDCNTAIYLDSQTCDFWKIVDCRVGAGIDKYALQFKGVGSVVIDSVLGAGNAIGSEAEAFLYLSPAHGTVTLISCECEGFKKSIEVAPGPALEANINWPILLLNNAFGPKVALNSNCDFVSVGNCYLPDTVQCGENGTDVMIFSFGDIIRPNQGLPAPTDDFNMVPNSRVAARSNRFRTDFQRPTRIGGQPGQPPPVLENIALAVAPLAEGEPQIVLCDWDGTAIWKLRADARTLFFEHEPTSETVMSLSRDGDLVIKGKLFENSLP
jgi:hypothetical protein